MILGIGLGIVITSLILIPSYKTYDDSYIEKRAKAMGMIYEDQVKVIDTSEVLDK
ncbi:hypothetical protein [Clostridium sp. DL1XJH146]